NGMSLTFFQTNWLGTAELDDFAIDADTDKSFAFRFFNNIAEFADLILHQRRKQNDLGFRIIGENLIDDLLWRLPVNRLAGVGIVWLTDRRKKNPQIIVNLGRRGDG